MLVIVSCTVPLLFLKIQHVNNIQNVKYGVIYLEDAHKGNGGSTNER